MMKILRSIKPSSSPPSSTRDSRREAKSAQQGKAKAKAKKGGAAPKGKAQKATNKKRKSADQDANAEG